MKWLLKKSKRCDLFIADMPPLDAAHHFPVLIAPYGTRFRPLHPCVCPLRVADGACDDNHHDRQHYHPATGAGARAILNHSPLRPRTGAERASPRFDAEPFISKETSDVVHR